MSKATELLKKLEEVCDRNGPADTGRNYPTAADVGKVDGKYPNSPDMKPGQITGQVRDVNYRK